MVDQVGFFWPMGAYHRCKGIDDDMRLVEMIRAFARMHALVIEVICVSRVLERIQALVIEVQQTYLSGISDDTMVS